MNEYIAFISNHWILSSAAGCLIVAYIAVEFFYNSKIKYVTPQQTVMLLNRENAVIIDIRSTDSFANGHISGAININSHMLTDEIAKMQKYINTPVIVTCNLGKSAVKVASILEKNGFKQVSCLAGGIDNWITCGLPIIK